MTAAQQRMLDLAGAACQPVKVPAGTARVLQGYGYLQPAGDGWEISERGRAHLDARRRDDEFHDVDRRLSREANAWGDRVVLWLLAHERLQGGQYDATYRYARHVAGALHQGIEPAAPAGTWGDGATAWVVAETTAAARCLRDYIEAGEKASAGGVDVLVSYKSGPTTPRARSEAADAAKAVDGTVSLLTYRERRPSKPSGGAA